MISIEFASPVVAPSPSLGEQCGRVFALLYPTATEQERSQAAQADACQLVAESERTTFVAAWEQGVRAAAVSPLPREEPCPCCGSYATLSPSMLITWQENEAGAVSLVPQSVCPNCAALESRRQYQAYLNRRSTPRTGFALLLLVFIVHRVPAHLVAEQIAAMFGGRVQLRASGTLLALLAERFGPDQMHDIASLISQGILESVCVSTISAFHHTDLVERCPCGHLLRSREEQKRRRCLECQMAMSLRVRKGERSE